MLKDLELSPRQRLTIAAALTLGAALLLIMAAAAAVWGLASFVTTFQGVLLPPVVAAILAMLLRPYHSWLVRLCRGSQAAGLALFFASALVPLAAVLWFTGSLAISQLLRLVEDLPSLVDSMAQAAQSVWPQIASLLDRLGLLSEIDQLIENPGAMASAALKASAGQVATSISQLFQSAIGCFAWAVLPVYLAFFLMAKPFDPRQVGNFLPFLKRSTREDVVFLFDQFVAILLTFFRGQIIIALAQGALYAVGFALVGLPYGILIGLALGLLNVIPYLGAIIGLAVALPLAYFGDGGGTTLLVLVLVVFVIVQLIESYFLTPKIMGDRTGLHPALIIFSVFFWGVALGGILGMLLAIPLTAFAVIFWRLLKNKYMSELL
jgi:predicted PurR-regulated permease PerM